MIQSTKWKDGASDVNNVADRTETPSSCKSWSEGATFNDVADRTETPSSRQKLKVNNLRVLYNGPSRVQVGYK